MNHKKEKGTGIRHNQGKLKYHLIPPNAMKKIAEVFTMGSSKYGDRNWENGMKWSNVYASLTRHLQEFLAGNDYDSESGLLHMAHVAVNAIFLLEYYDIYPWGDDRKHRRDRPLRIGLDIDDVLCDFTGGMLKQERISNKKSTHWQFFDNIEFSKLPDSFYLDLEMKIKPEDIPFEPFCYITHRQIDESITRRWLDSNNYPRVPIIQIPKTNKKSDIANKLGLDIFIDDNYDNFVDLNNNGILCYLMDTEHNRKYNVGYKRIKTLYDIPFDKLQ